MKKVQQTEARLPDAAASQGRASPGRTVLAVDDDANVLGRIKMLLHRAGGQVLTAADAAIALRCLRCQPVDMVLIELSLPGMDGPDFLGQLKRDPATRALPVLIVSAHSDTEVQARCAALAAAGYLSKPFRGRDLGAAMDQILDRTLHL
jgi:CheY-like chemotaxis protein